MSNMIKYEEVRLVNSSDIDMIVERLYKLPYRIRHQNPEHTSVEELTYWVPSEVEEGAFTVEEWATNICPETETSKNHFKENTYPDLQSVLNELHRRGLIPEGLYFISK